MAGKGSDFGASPASGSQTFSFEDPTANAFSAAVEARLTALQQAIDAVDRRLTLTQTTIDNTVAAGVQSLNQVVDQQRAEGETLKSQVGELFVVVV